MMAEWTRQQIIPSGAFRSVSEHFEAFRNKPLPLDAFESDWNSRFPPAGEVKQKSVPSPVDRFSDADDSVRQKPPPLISMTFRCAYVEPISRGREAVKAPAPQSGAPSARP